MQYLRFLLPHANWIFFWSPEKILEKFIQLEEILLLEEMTKEYLDTHLQNLHIGMHKEMIQFIKTPNEDPIHTILQAFIVIIIQNRVAFKFDNAFNLPPTCFNDFLDT